MSKRVRSESPAVDVEEQLHQLSAALGDASRFRDVLENALPEVDERLVAFLAKMSAYVPANFGQQEQSRTVPAEALLDVLGFLSRDDLDSAQLSCRRLCSLVQDAEETSLTLRPIQVVHLGKRDTYGLDNLPAWNPVGRVVRDGFGNREFQRIPELSLLLRLTYCKAFCLEVGRQPTLGFCKYALYDLLAEKTVVGELYVDCLLADAGFVSATVGIFKSVNALVIGASDISPVDFDDWFFEGLIACGVRELRFKGQLVADRGKPLHVVKTSIDTSAILAFCFDDLENGDDRYISAEVSGRSTRPDLLPRILEKVGELDEDGPFEFCFTIDGLTDVELDGFEKYKQGVNRLVVDDLPNGFIVEVSRESGYFVKLHVRIFTQS